MTDTEIVAAIRAILDGGTPIIATPPALSYWWDPSPADHVAFAAEHDVTVAAISPIDDSVAGGIGTAFPVLPAVSSQADVLRYAGFGFKPNGSQQLFFASYFKSVRGVCKDLLGATTPATIDRIVTRASTADTDAVRLALMTGLTRVGSLIPTVYGFGPHVSDVIAVLTFVPAGMGPGPGGPR